jgi:thiol-disulfide isomerase/thioredoxin
MLARFRFRNNDPLKRLDLMFVLALVLGIIWFAFVSVVPLKAANPDQMVVFTAKWCASCATLVPGVQEVTKKLAIPFTLIDVDSPSAPTQAGNFGLTIPRDNLPQGYYIRGGTPSLVLNGKLYHAGQAAKARQDVEGSLIQNR